MDQTKPRVPLATEADRSSGMRPAVVTLDQVTSALV